MTKITGIVRIIDSLPILNRPAHTLADGFKKTYLLPVSTVVLAELHASPIRQICAVSSRSGGWFSEMDMGNHSCCSTKHFIIMMLDCSLGPSFAGSACGWFESGAAI